MRSPLRSLLLAAVLLGAAIRPADAHIVSSRLGDFYGGMLHPLTSLPDVVLWVALGLLVGLQPLRVARWIAPVFPAGLVAGFGAGLWWGWTADPLRLDAAVMVVLGLLAATAARLPAAVLMPLAFGLAALRGAANVAGVEPGTDAVLFAGGLAVAGYATVTLLTAVVEAFRAPGAGWRGIAVRAGGSWIAAIGVMVGGATFIR